MKGPLRSRGLLAERLPRGAIAYLQRYGGRQWKGAHEGNGSLAVAASALALPALAANERLRFTKTPTGYLMVLRRSDPEIGADVLQLD